MARAIAFETAVETARRLRETLLQDPYRPGYHFAIPEGVGVPGDPNGGFYANGRYHLMYLYDRRGGIFRHNKNFCWGHVSSHDLIHWRHHPDAIIAGDDDGGCFSGGAFVNDDGTAYLTYWALPFDDDGPDGSGVGIARSCDRHYKSWEKIAKINCTERGILETRDEDGNTLYLANADPSNIWKQNGIYYLQAGNKPVLDKCGRDEHSPAFYKGDWVDLFKSGDLMNWEYAGRFYERRTDNSWTDESEDAMCPSFLPLPVRPEGGKESGKFLQLFISHNRGCQYYIGDYDTAHERFIPESHGRMSWIDNTYFAPEALLAPDGRQIMWAWLRDNPRDAFRKYGWSGVYGLPRSLWLGGGNTLRMAPVEELKQLRYNERGFSPITLAHGEEKALDGINGESCEIRLALNIGSAKRIGLSVRTSPDREEKTLLYVDVERNALVFDSTKSGVDGRPAEEVAPFKTAPSGEVQLRVFIDKSVVEVFADDRQAVARRVYPERPDSTGVYLFSESGEGAFQNIQTWEMMPSNAH